MFGLAADGSVIVPYPFFELPTQVYEQFSASDLELCAISQDHRLVCAPNPVPPELAAQRFTQVAVEFWGGMCALREDQSVACDGLGRGESFVPPSDHFTKLAAMNLGMCGIRSDGSIGCFGLSEVTPPPGW